MTETQHRKVKRLKSLLTSKPLLGQTVHWVTSRSSMKSACGRDRQIASGMTDNVNLVTCMKCMRSINRMHAEMSKQKLDEERRRQSIGLTKDELGPPAEGI